MSAWRKVHPCSGPACLVCFPSPERGAERRECTEELEALASRCESSRTFIGTDEARALAAKWREGQG